VEVGKQAQTIVNSGPVPDYQIYMPLGWAPWVRVTYSGQNQKDYAEESEVPVFGPSSKRSWYLWIPMPAAVRVLVLVSAHPKLHVTEFCQTLRLDYVIA
jgi:hypothetical protein